MTQNPSQQGRSATLDHDSRPEVEFDQWAKAVRQQMVAALKRRSNQ